jgi:hypothetical protein
MRDICPHWTLSHSRQHDTPVVLSHDVLERCSQHKASGMIAGPPQITTRVNGAGGDIVRVILPQTVRPGQVRRVKLVGVLCENDNHKCAQLYKKITRGENQLFRMRRTLRGQNARRSTLNKAIAKRSATVVAKECELFELNASIATVDAEVFAKGAELARKNVVDATMNTALENVVVATKDAICHTVYDTETVCDVRNVYFVRLVGSDLVKIGYARYPLQRLLSLQRGNFMALAIVYIVSTARFKRLFENIHEHLTELGYCIKGDWFMVSPAISLADIVRVASDRKVLLC